MERKKLISRIDRAHTTPEQQAAIDHHMSREAPHHKYEGNASWPQGIILTSMKAPMRWTKR